MRASAVAAVARLRTRRRPSGLASLVRPRVRVLHTRSSRPSATGAAERALVRAVSLLRGGVPPARVWPMLCEDRPLPDGLAMVAERLATSADCMTALAAGPGPEWRVIAAAWRLAEVSGAPLATSLERLAGSLRELNRVAERRKALLAGPRATIALVSALPLAAVGLGMVLGLDPLEVLLSARGVWLLVSGLLLLGLGVLWANALADRLARADWVAGLELEFMWIALAGGTSPGSALLRVADCADAARAEWVRLSTLAREGQVQQVLRAAEHLGTALGPMLLAEAVSARSRAHGELEQAAERLGVQVLLPVGLLVLPSFVLLGVLPVLFAVLGGIGT